MEYDKKDENLDNMNLRNTCSTQDIDAHNTLRILIVTDNHVGCRENDGIRGQDSFIAFEECLRLAKHLKVDCICHAGDLFDLHKPSRSTEYKVLDLLRKYCLGDDPIAFEVLNPSDPLVFPFGRPNFLCPDINISIPIFIIHGNHDDPGEESCLSAIDILSVSNLVNYFGKADDLDAIKVSPILLRKGSTKVALYGLGNVRDERLHRAFRSLKVSFLVPESGTSDFFNLFMIHQNRHKGNLSGIPNKNCISEELLPDFLDLVIWGHEHECQIDAQESLKGSYHVIQPGSSCITSLSASEALPKHICLLEICGDAFRSTPIPLRCTRPFEFDEVCLAELGHQNMTDDDIWEALNQEVQTLIARARDTLQRRHTSFLCSAADELLGRNFDLFSFGGKWGCNYTDPLDSDSNWKLKLPLNQTDRQGDAKDTFCDLGHMKKKDEDFLLEKLALPIIRLRVEHSGFPQISTTRFGSQFIGQVANPEDILYFYKKKRFYSSKPQSALTDQRHLQFDGPKNLEGFDIQDLVCDNLVGIQGLDILPSTYLNKAVDDFVHKMESSAIERFVKNFCQDALSAIKESVKESKLENGNFLNSEEIRAIVRSNAEAHRIAHMDEEIAFDRKGSSGNEQLPSNISSQPQMEVKEEFSNSESEQPVTQSQYFSPSPKNKGLVYANGTQKSAVGFPKKRQLARENRPLFDDEDDDICDAIQDCGSSSFAHAIGGRIQNTLKKTGIVSAENNRNPQNENAPFSLNKDGMIAPEPRRPASKGARRGKAKAKAKAKTALKKSPSPQPVPPVKVATKGRDIGSEAQFGLTSSTIKCRRSGESSDCQSYAYKDTFDTEENIDDFASERSCTVGRGGSFISGRKLNHPADSLATRLDDDLLGTLSQYDSQKDLFEADPSMSSLSVSKQRSSKAATRRSGGRLWGMK